MRGLHSLVRPFENTTTGNFYRVSFKNVTTTLKNFVFESWPRPKFALRIFEEIELPFTTLFKDLKALLKKIKYCFDVNPCRLYKVKNASSHWQRLTLKMLVQHSSETYVTTYQTVRCNNAQDLSHHFFSTEIT
jgi:hypothetical protein